jgi:hypothetical protein
VQGGTWDSGLDRGGVGLRCRAGPRRGLPKDPSGPKDSQEGVGHRSVEIVRAWEGYISSI